MGGRRLGQWKSLANQNLQLALTDEVEAVLVLLEHQFMIGRSRVKHEAADLQRFFKETKNVKLVGRSTGPSIQYRVAERREAAQSFFESWLADCIKNQVDALAAGQA